MPVPAAFKNGIPNAMKAGSPGAAQGPSGAVPDMTAMSGMMGMTGYGAMPGGPLSKLSLALLLFVSTMHFSR